MEERLWRYKDTALYLNMPVGSLYALVCQGRIPHLRLSGRSVRFEPAEVRKWLEEMRRGTLPGSGFGKDEMEPRK